MTFWRQGPPPEIKSKWVKAPIDDMKNGKAEVNTGSVSKMLMASGDISVT